MSRCPKCTRDKQAGWHTCTPTKEWTELEAKVDRYREALAQAADLIRSGNPTTAEIEIRRCLIDHK